MQPSLRGVICAAVCCRKCSKKCCACEDAPSGAFVQADILLVGALQALHSKASCHHTPSAASQSAAGLLIAWLPACLQASAPLVGCHQLPLIGRGLVYGMQSPCRAPSCTEQCRAACYMLPEPCRQPPYLAQGPRFGVQLVVRLQNQPPGSAIMNGCCLSLLPGHNGLKHCWQHRGNLSSMQLPFA